MRHKVSLDKSFVELTFVNEDHREVILAISHRHGPRSLEGRPGQGKPGIPFGDLGVLGGDLGVLGGDLGILFGTLGLLFGALIGAILGWLASLLWRHGRLGLGGQALSASRGRGRLALQPPSQAVDPHQPSCHGRL